MPILQTILYYICCIQMFFAIRYVVKASFGNVPEYRFYKLLMVFFIPIAGYFFVMKEPLE